MNSGPIIEITTKYYDDNGGRIGCRGCNSGSPGRRARPCERAPGPGRADRAVGSAWRACGLSRDPGGRRRLQPLCDRRWPWRRRSALRPGRGADHRRATRRRAWRKPSGGNRAEPAPDTGAERRCIRCAGEPGDRAARVQRYRDRAAGRRFHDECTWRGARNPAVPVEVATRVRPTVSPGRLLFERSASAFGFTLGERGPLVVLFGDPLCPWSRSAVARIGREAMAGKLRLHVVPVALLGAASAHRAAGIAASSNPAQAWFARTDGPSGVQARERIAGNNALFDAWGERSVPLIAYRAMQGGIAHRVGDIADLGAWLRELGDE